MSLLRLYQLVQVTQLLHPLDNYDGWGFNKRPPAVGDVGTIVDVLTVRDLPDKYVVEAIEDGGKTIWLAAFDAEELSATVDTA